MGVNVKQNELRSLEVRNRVIRGVMLKVIAQASLVNVDITASPIDLSKVNFKASLTRGGAEYKIAQDKLQILGMYSGFNDATFTDCHTGTSTVLTPHGVGQKGLVMQTVIVDFKGILDLKAGDTLKIDVEILPSAWDSDVDAAVSYIMVDDIETTGQEVLTPTLRSLAIAPGESGNDYSLGSNVSDIVFINTDILSNELADDVVSSVTLTSSNGYNLNDNAIKMMAKRLEFFWNKADSNARYKSYILAAPERPLHNVALSLQFIGVNVASGKNYIVWSESIRTK